MPVRGTEVSMDVKLPGPGVAPKATGGGGVKIVPRQSCRVTDVSAGTELGGEVNVNVIVTISSMPSKGLPRVVVCAHPPGALSMKMRNVEVAAGGAADAAGVRPTTSSKAKAILAATDFKRLIGKLLGGTSGARLPLHGKTDQ